MKSGVLTYVLLLGISVISAVASYFILPADNSGLSNDVAIFWYILGALAILASISLLVLSVWLLFRFIIFFRFVKGESVFNMLIRISRY